MQGHPNLESSNAKLRKAIDTRSTYFLCQSILSILHTYVFRTKCLNNKKMFCIDTLLPQCADFQTVATNYLCIINRFINYLFLLWFGELIYAWKFGFSGETWIFLQV